MIGHVIGAYRVIRQIGVGGMGTVYLAEHNLLGRRVALKVLLPEMTRKPDMVQRFFNEARAVAAVHHRGIVEVYDVGHVDADSAYIAMEFLDGETLAARLARGRMSSTTAIAIIREVAGALAAAHRADIIHRDLKPDNVFLAKDRDAPRGERVKLLDFGIAKLLWPGENGVNTRTGTIIGTPTYMAPEQCRGVAIDRRVDLYALGCILFEMLTGRPPFRGEGMGDILAAHVYLPAPAVSTLVPEVPPALDALVARLLVKAPAGRLQSAAELLAGLDALEHITRRPARSQPPPAGEPPTERMARVAPVGDMTEPQTAIPEMAHAEDDTTAPRVLIPAARPSVTTLQPAGLEDAVARARPPSVGDAAPVAAGAAAPLVPSPEVATPTPAHRGRLSSRASLALVFVGAVAIAGLVTFWIAPFRSSGSSVPAPAPAAPDAAARRDTTDPTDAMATMAADPSPRDESLPRDAGSAVDAATDSPTARSTDAREADDGSAGRRRSTTARRVAIPPAGPAAVEGTEIRGAR